MVLNHHVLQIFLLMKNNNQNLIEDIENLCFVFVEFCNNNKNTEENQGIVALANCIYDKVQKLYVETFE